MTPETMRAVAAVFAAARKRVRVLAQTRKAA